MLKFKDLPKEIQNAMLDEQVRQGNKRDRKVFENYTDCNVQAGGFSWANSREKYFFWSDIIHIGKTKVFFDRYPLKLTAKRNKNGNNKDFQENKPHFDKQAHTILKWMLRGYWADSKKMFERFGIVDARPRFRAIRQHLELECQKVPNGKGLKRWRILPTKLAEYKKMYK